MIPILLLALLAQSGPRRTGFSDTTDGANGRVRSGTQTIGPGAPGIAFQLAPASGSGMGTVCACAAITAATGQAITVTRASDATCTKGNETSSIADGDLVTCTSGQPRVMPGGDGSGYLGLAVSASSTNSTIRNRAFENAAWVATNSGIAAPTITADYATGPGTGSAERIQIPAAGAGTSSYISQSTSCPTGVARTHSLYVRGTSSSGTILIGSGAAFGSGAGLGGYSQCTYVSGSWTRCVHRVAVTTSTAVFSIGTSPLEGTVTTSAIDALVWGAQCEATVDPTPVILTDGTAATRNAEVVTAPYSQTDDTSGSMAVTLVSPYATMGSLGEHTLLGEQVAGSYNRLLLLNTNVEILYGYGINATYAAGTLPINTERRAAYWWTPSTSGIFWNSVPSGGTLFPSGDVSTIQIGSYNAGSSMTNGVLKNICADSSSTVCR